jgi:nucleoid-associated protein YgaU
MNLKETLKYLKLHESTISMLLGVIVILVAGVMFINYFSHKERTNRLTQIGDEGTKVITHVIQKGETLSSIAQEYYNNPDGWQAIAKQNNIQDPNDIQTGQSLVIPSLTPTSAPVIAQATITPKPTEIPTTITPKSTNAPATPTPEPTKAPVATPTSTPTPTVFTENGEGGVFTEARTHTVEKGETLWSIAEYYFQSGYNWIDIAQANKLQNPGQIEVGQQIFIPNVQPKQITIKTPTTIAQTNPITGATYTVVKGDNLWKIAVRAYGDGYKWVDIAKENSLENPDLIFAGNTLSLPR